MDHYTHAAICIDGIRRAGRQSAREAHDDHQPRTMRSPGMTPKPARSNLTSLLRDVYAASSHRSRRLDVVYGSAGWMYRLIVESLLGLRLEVEVALPPCLPAHWPSFTIHYRYRDTPYHIVFTQRPTIDGEPGVMTVKLDGADQPEAMVPLVDDRREHAVEVSVPAKPEILAAPS
jgi:cellobiose phosphorylase